MPTDTGSRTVTEMLQLIGTECSTLIPDIETAESLDVRYQQLTETQIATDSQLRKWLSYSLGVTLNGSFVDVNDPTNLRLAREYFRDTGKGLDTYLEFAETQVLPYLEEVDTHMREVVAADRIAPSDDEESLEVRFNLLTDYISGRVEGQYRLIGAASYTAEHVLSSNIPDVALDPNLALPGKTYDLFHPNFGAMMSDEAKHDQVKDTYLRYARDLEQAVASGEIVPESLPANSQQRLSRVLGMLNVIDGLKSYDKRLDDFEPLLIDCQHRIVDRVMDVMVSDYHEVTEPIVTAMNGSTKQWRANGLRADMLAVGSRQPIVKAAELPQILGVLNLVGQLIDQATQRGNVASESLALLVELETTAYGELKRFKTAAGDSEFDSSNIGMKLAKVNPLLTQALGTVQTYWQDIRYIVRQHAPDHFDTLREYFDNSTQSSRTVVTTSKLSHILS